VLLKWFASPKGEVREEPAAEADVAPAPPAG
jgi:hypothetical protein